MKGADQRGKRGEANGWRAIHTVVTICQTHDYGSPPRDRRVRQARVRRVRSRITDSIHAEQLHALALRLNRIAVRPWLYSIEYLRSKRYEVDVRACSSIGTPGAVEQFSH